MSNLGDDFRATADAVRSDASEIERLEAEKAKLNPGDPQIRVISDRIERIARRLEDKASSERQLSDELDKAFER